MWPAHQIECRTAIEFSEQIIEASLDFRNDDRTEPRRDSNGSTPATQPKKENPDHIRSFDRMWSRPVLTKVIQQRQSGKGKYENS
jgi:hypothetical protein